MMSKLNQAFPCFSKEMLVDTPREVSEALLEKGVCYITVYEHLSAQVFEEYECLGQYPDGTIKVLSTTKAKVSQPNIYSILFAPEFKEIKRRVLGKLFKDEIEIFCQHTGPSEVPTSGHLHFDKRFTFKSWYYLNDIGLSNGPMRVVPLDRCEEFSPIALRRKFGTRHLFKGSQHAASIEANKLLEPAAEHVTGPKGTLFLHITEAWHGASPVLPGFERKIIRGHSRRFSDYFIR